MKEKVSQSKPILNRLGHIGEQKKVLVISTKHGKSNVCYQSATIEVWISDLASLEVKMH